MSFFYNGRLWTSPAVMSSVNDAAMANANPGVGNVLAILGAATGGAPNTAVSFGNPVDAAAYYGSGDLVDAITRAFNPSAEIPGGPSAIIGIRVNPAVQSALTLLDGSSGNAITLASTDYGLKTNQIKVKVEAATNVGLKLTTQLGLAYYSQDDVHRNAFSIRYGGAQLTGTMTISNSQCILSAPTGTPVATIALATYPTVQQLVDFINTVTDFSAAVLDGNGAAPTLNGLDAVTAVDVKTALYTATAHLQAAVDWFNGQGEGYVTATRAGTKIPAVLPFTYLSGGSDGSITNTEWSNAFTALQSQDVQWVVPCSTDPAIHAMTDAHVAFMSTTMRKERRAFCGTPLSTSDTAAIALAKAINSDRTSLTHLGGYDYNAAGILTLYSPFIVAAMFGGMAAGANPGTPLTNKSLKLRGIERNLRNPTDTDALLNGGIMCVENTRTGFRVVKSISTWLTNTNFNRVEVSTGFALDFAVRSVREALSSLKGAKGNPTVLTQAVSRTETVLRGLAVAEPNGPGVLAGDANSPAYLGIKATLTGDVLAVSFQCSPVIPVNYIPVTVYATPYSGSATVSN